MNQWDCDHPGCTNSAIGVGGARGLRAIGWQFIKGHGFTVHPRCYCPAHRTDLAGVVCRDERGSTTMPCCLCAAQRDAERLQALWPDEGKPPADALKPSGNGGGAAK